MTDRHQNYNKHLCVTMGINTNGKNINESINEMRYAVDKIIDDSLKVEYDKVRINKNINNIMAYTVIEAGLTLEAEKIKTAFEQQLNDIYKRKTKVKQPVIKMEQLRSS